MESHQTDGEIDELSSEQNEQDRQLEEALAIQDSQGKDASMSLKRQSVDSINNAPYLDNSNFANQTE